ncbi:MAG: urease accessory UreF family protein [Betaproteobacteria bacterium]
MSDVAAALAALQLGDSAFPSGSMAFSWGLETLRADGQVNNAIDVAALVAGQLEQRWAEFDRPAIVAAHAAAGDLDVVCAVDREVDAATLAREAREGGRRIGSAVLKVHEGMGTRGVAAYRDCIARGDAFGQMAVVQGFVAEASGLGAEAACALSAHQLMLSLTSAAIRLGLMGHVDAQRILADQRTRVAAIMASPCPIVGAIQAYAPAAEIAMMRHETGSGRMFAS